METLIVLGIGYIIGAVPYGFILVKIIHNKDIREIGSLNIGATNVLRAGYPILAFLTLFLDALKGFVTVIIVRFVLDMPDSLYIISSISVVFGHMFSVFIMFKGGKGVATSLGAILALEPYASFISIIIWVTIASISRYSSLAAIITFIILPICAWFLNPIIVVPTTFISLLVIFKHKDNIKRLINGTETKIKLFN